MTDKQIIIEDCPYFVNGVCMEYLDGACENHKCDLKIIRELEQKLKAKEQECEGLRYEVGSLENDRDILKEQLDQLKAELEQEKALKETYLACYKAKHEDIEGKLFNLKSENDELKRQIEVERKDNWSVRGQLGEAECLLCRYDRTLTEIKEIAEDLITITDEYDNCYHKDECDKCLLGIDGNCQYIKVEQILQKISEVEE